jgi:two-component system, chemotaxis family, protein-glutamate methylesterase/glutaminase
MTDQFDEPEPSRPEPFPGAAFDCVALCASAGGFNALRDVLSGLPGDFPAAIVVVQHLDPRHRSVMAELLSRRCRVDVRQANVGDVLEPAVALIAPPDRHLLVNGDGTISLTQTQLVHFVRPSGDLLFESVAASYRDRAIAVVLSGTGQDGAQGTRAIKKVGGTVIVQDEASAEFFGMPSAAIRLGTPDFVLSLEEIAPTLEKLVRQSSL